MAPDGTSYCPTVFPAPLAVAASFNRSLMRLRGSTTGVEARAFNNLHVDRIYLNPVDLLAFGPDLNLIVDPRNGRNGENPTEDGYLAGQYAIEYVRGAQEGPEDPSRLQLAMSLKHFAGYQSETNRFASNFTFSEFDLQDTYLVPFAAGFSPQGGNASGAMCSYNSLSGVPACADPWLLKSMVEFWGQPDAFIMSDCGAVEDQFEDKHTATSYADASAQSLLAGTDWCMGTAFTAQRGLADALAQGLLPPAALDGALARTLRLRFALGMFDAPPRHASPFTLFGAERIGSLASRQAAEEAAAQGAVLLRNEGGALPVALGNAALKAVAVVGPHAVSQRDLLGDFYGDAFCPGNSTRGHVASGCVPTLASSILDVLAGARPDVAVLVARGVGIVDPDTSGVAAALAAVGAADVVFLAVGYNNADVEREGADHNFTGLPPVQAAFSASVLAAAASRGVPVVMVLVNAGQIATDTLPSQPSALVEAFYPAFGAPALARQLFGLSNAWGRLPYTMYDSSFAAAIPLADMNVSGAVGRTWRYHKGAPNYAFGAGLSYATFSLACSGGPDAFPAGPALALRLNCSSAWAGSAAGLGWGDEVLLVVHRVGADVVRAVGGAHPVPRGTLRGFERLTLRQGGGAAGAGWALGARDLALTDARGRSVLYPGTHFLDVVPRAPGAAWTLAVTVTGGAPVVLAAPPAMPQRS